MTNVNEILDNGEEVDGGIRPCNELTKDFLEEFLIQKGANQEKHEKKKDDDQFYVNDLFKCRRMCNEKTHEMSMQTLTKDPVIIGILVEEGLDRYMKSLGFVTQMRYETNIDGHKISGRVDYYDFERKIGVELKSPIYVKKKPKKAQHYINQAKAYLWISQYSEHPIEEMRLLQLSSTGRKEFRITEGFTDEDIKGFINNPQYPFYMKSSGDPYTECKYCDIKEDCPHIGD